MKGNLSDFLGSRRFLLLMISLYLALAAAIFPAYRYQLNADGVSCISIARKCAATPTLNSLPARSESS